MAALARRLRLAPRVALAASRILVTGAVLSSASPALASGPIGSNGSPIRTSDYAIDLYQGPVFAGTRVTGLAGAYSAIAEDVDGDLQNPAAPAVRPPYSLDHFDYALGLGVTLPAQLKGMDFWNSGGRTSAITNSPDSFVFLTPALNLQWGEFGVGATAELQTYSLSRNVVPAGQRDASFEATTAITHLQVAYGVERNQWVVGGGVRLANFSVSNRLAAGQGGASFSSVGAGLELGMVYKPEKFPFRIGGAVHSAVKTQASYSDSLLPNADGDLTVSDPEGNLFYLPRSVALPWDANIGVAFQFGRPMNPRRRPFDERIERETLVHRLGQLDREKRREDARALPPQERAVAEYEIDVDERASEAVYARQLLDARRAVSRELAAAQPFYVLVSASLVATGTAESGVGMESFLSGQVNRSGRKVVFSPRLGAESEIFERTLRVRAGSYLEPTRFETSSARVHGTLGFDARLFTWSVFGLYPENYVFRLSLAADAAERFFTWGIALGSWYPRDPLER